MKTPKKQTAEIGVNRTLREIGLNKSTFYNWYHAYSKQGVEGLMSNKRVSNRQWNSIPEEQKNLVIDIALDNPDQQWDFHFIMNYNHYQNLE